MPFKYDIAIVGAGPAGSTAAYILGKQGYHVLLLDKERFPRKKLCGGCLTAKTIRLLNRVFNEPADALIRENIINFTSHRFEIRYKTKTLVNSLSPFPFHFVDRQVYDAFLLRKAKDAGVDVIQGEKVTDIQAKAHGRELTLTTSKDRFIQAKFIIGADGVNSTLRTKLFQQKKIKSSQWQHNLAYGLEIFLPKKEAIEPIDVPILSFGYLRWGYAWIFPNKDRLVVGIGGLNRKNKNLTDQFKRFLSDYNFGSIDSLKIQGHPLPFGNFFLTSVYKNVLLAGDAAGLVDPMLGEGIYQAHKSGELAAKAIGNTLENHTNQDPGTNYLHLLQKHLMTEFIYARRFRWFVYNSLSHILKYRHIKLMGRYFDKLAEVVHGARTYKWFKKKKN
ncbi:MAG: geranylgeranyl reductase family protein [Candidatus Aminicenantes bacterium]|nr:MAG: geranylgeranyl reductase family protein [Candidatus Aminicenantes bacterium]